MVRSFLGWCAVAAILCACGQPTQTVRTQGETTIVESRSADGAVSRMQGGADVKPPENLPESVALYPGMTLQSVMSGSADGKAGGMLIGSSPDAPAAVAEFYRAKLKAAGASNLSDIQMNGAFIIGAGDESGVAASVQIAPREEGGSSIAITYSQ